MCREAGGRVSTNVFLRDMALDTVQADGRRLEVVVEGLPLFRGAQLAIDTTLVSPLGGDGQPHRRCVDVDRGSPRRGQLRREERTYPELCERHSRARLVVLAAEVGSRWSDEAADFLKQLAWSSLSMLTSVGRTASLTQSARNGCQTVEAFAGLHSRRQGHDRQDRHAHVLELDENAPQQSEITRTKKMGECTQASRRDNVQNQSNCWYVPEHDRLFCRRLPKHSSTSLTADCVDPAMTPTKEV